MTRWEYQCIDAPHDRVSSRKVGGESSGSVEQIEHIMNELGDQGWELVGVRSGAFSAREKRFGATLFFKRAKGWAS